MIEEVHGIQYERPRVFLLHDSGIGVAELAGRTAYDSFSNSENLVVKTFNENVDREDLEYYQYDDMIEHLNRVYKSELLDQLAWVHHHHSVIEHATVSYLIKGTSRGVLQEHARHRIQAITVRSTRYTMSSVINAFVASVQFYKYSKGTSIGLFRELVNKIDLFVTKCEAYNSIEIDSMYNKLLFQLIKLGEDEFYSISLSKENLAKLHEFQHNTFNMDDVRNFYINLEGGKKKRNVGDAFKHIVTDNWKVDMVVTFNLRSLKNYFDLRDSGAAYFQIRWLAEEMKKVTPKKYLRLIDKKVKEENE